MSRYTPMQRSAKARWHMRNLGTVSLQRLVNNTSSTVRLPAMARMLMNQMATRKKPNPAMSSQGLKASASGLHWRAGRG